MKKAFKKVFGGINLTWPELILSAVAAGVFTAIMALIPALHYTSFHAIAVTFEVWIFFGILIIMNSRSNLDSALKCFVFFLISQPLVYLIQVPFSSLGWGLFGYYKYWFIWTLLCFPMGYVGYYMKKGKWWGYLILLPMIVLTAYSFACYFSDFLFYMPKYILICLFCACAMILYPVVIFDDKKIRITGATTGLLAVIVLTVVGILHPPVYSTDVLSDGEENKFDSTYTACLADEKYGRVEIIFIDSIDSYMVHGDFRKAGSTVLTLESPNGDKTEYNITIERDSYEITKK